MSIKRLGKVLHLSKSGRLVLRSQDRARLGAKVVDQDLKVIGTVFDVFGPIKNPYISVKASVSSPARLVGRLLYVEEAVERRR